MEEFCNGGPKPCRGKDCVDKERGGVKYDPSGPRIQGWDEMKAMCVTAYYDVPWLVYTPKQDKGSILFTGSQPENYTTSLIGNWTVDFIKRHAAAARSGSPFFVSAATRAPHSPQTPAPWYANALPEVKNLVDRPDFNFTSSAATKAAGAGHASYIEAEPPVTAAEAVTFDNEFRDRWRTLMSVSASCPTPSLLAGWFCIIRSVSVGWTRNCHVTFSTSDPDLVLLPLSPSAQAILSWAFCLCLPGG